MARQFWIAVLENERITLALTLHLIVIDASDPGELVIQSAVIVRCAGDFRMPRAGKSGR
jgi:hypothetical protein